MALSSGRHSESALGEGMLRVLCWFYLSLVPLWAVGLRVVSYNVGAHYTDEGYPNFSLGNPGTLDHDSVVAVLSRIDADVIALQEIHAVDVAGNPDDLDALAASLGCPYKHVASTSGSFDTSLRVVILSRFPLIEAEDIRSAAGAKEITRHFPVVRVDVPGTANDPVIISAHLKAGTRTADRFRRAIEMQRLAGYVESEGLGVNDNLIILGDFNPSGVAKSYSELPAGMPVSFVMGAGIGFPVNYSPDMLSYFNGMVPLQLDPRQLNGSDGTFQFGQTLDLLMVSPGISKRPIGLEVYNSALDVSNDDGLLKQGVPLAGSISLEASDHYAVFADLELDDPGEGGPYIFAMAGELVVEDFDGFVGFGDPSQWATDAKIWQGRDDGVSSVAGARSYGLGSDGALGYLGDGQVMMAEAKFLNQSSMPLTILDVGYMAEQWRASFGGSEDAISVELVTAGGVRPLHELSYLASTDLADGAVLGGSGESRSTRVGGLAIAPGEEFQLRFSFTPGVGWGAPSEEVFLNEIHYDNSGSDVGEFVEIVVGPGFSGEASSVQLLLYNGNNGMVYGNHGLETFTEGAVSPSGYRVFSKEISGIQNGAPDAMALVVAGSVVSFLSYEGVVTAVDGVASGMLSTNLGVSQNGSEPPGMNAIGLSGTGCSAADFSWVKLSGIPHSPGALNQGQSIVLPGLPPQGLAIDDLRVGFVADHDLDGIGDDLDPDDDNDGMIDAEELAFGSDPQDAGSRFEVTLEGGNGPAELVFPAALGVLYRVEWCDDLIDWKLLSSHAGTGGELRIPLPQDEARAFFRVAVGD